MMTSLPRHLLCTIGLALLPAVASAGNARIALKAEDGRFVVAEDGGGRELRANRDSRSTWETFTLFDLDGGALEDGDVIVLRAADGHFVAAEAGGGRELRADRDRAADWEHFVLERSDGSGTVRSGERVSLATGRGHFVSARGGELFADRTTVDKAEILTIVIVDVPKRARLSAPFAEPGAFAGPIGMDDDHGNVGNPARCRGHYGENFPNCYDEHEGSDFMLKGWFPGMELRANPVLAAAGGLVLEVADGRGDHCFVGPVVDPAGGGLDRHQIVCPDNKARKANFVRILQDDGDIASYFHLKRDSVAVRVGDRVACGQRLGDVGSSGISASPHLHFDLRRDGLWVDPYREGAWEKLDARIPQRTCDAPPAAGSRVCSEVHRRFRCDTQPARGICEGLQTLTGSTCVLNSPRGCLKTCNDLCRVVEETVERACG